MLKLALVAVLLVAVLVVGGLASAIAFGTATPPPPLASVNEPFKHIDYSDVPPAEAYRARDGAMLAYRAYPAGSTRVAVLVHGSSGNGRSMHLLAKTLRDAGITTYALDIRGHGASGTPGDIGYVGQLDDDMADFVAVVRRRDAQANLALIGFSSGGGFALRFAGGQYGNLFDRYVLISPALHHTAPTFRPNAGGWVAVHVPRLIALTILRRIGITWFDGLPVLAFAVAPNNEAHQVGSYSFRLATNFGVDEHYRDDVRRAPKPLSVLVGGADELFHPDRFAPLFAAAKPGIPVAIVAGLGHIDMITKPAGVAAIGDALATE